MNITALSTEAKRVLLLIEDEPVLRASLVRGLSRLPEVEVIDVASVGAALHALDALTPSMVLSDLDLPDGSGLEIATALDQRGLGVPLIFVSAYVDRFRAQLSARRDIEVYEKPVPMERLRAIVERALEIGDLEPTPFGIADYVQLAAMGRRSVVLDVRSVTVEGRIVIEAGEIRSAVDSLGGGMDAFRRLAFLKAATVRCRVPARGERFDRNIDGPCEGILLEAARLEDESAPRQEELELDWNSVDGSLDPLEPSSLDHEPLAPDDGGFAALYEEAVGALLERDYRRAYEAFCAAKAISPEDPKVRTNLKRLRSLGYGG